MTIVYLALGSNLGDREAHLRRGITELNRPELRITKISPVYETAPQGYLDQGWFLNLVVEAESELIPDQVLRCCQRVERLLKRQRDMRNGPRTIDVDIILFGDLIIDAPGLRIPHPRYPERRFVLEPLASIAPDLRDPLTKRSVSQMLGRVEDQQLTRTDIAIEV